MPEWNFAYHGFFSICQLVAWECKVSTFPFLKDAPTPSFLLLQLALNDGFLFLNEIAGSIWMVAKEAAPMFIGTIVFENVEKAMGSQLVHQIVLSLKQTNSFLNKFWMKI